MRRTSKPEAAHRRSNVKVRDLVVALEAVQQNPAVKGGCQNNLQPVASQSRAQGDVPPTRQITLAEDH
jgi:hypothetical protein